MVINSAAAAKRITHSNQIQYFFSSIIVIQIAIFQHNSMKPDNYMNNDQQEVGWFPPPNRV